MKKTNSPPNTESAERLFGSKIFSTEPTKATNGRMPVYMGDSESGALIGYGETTPDGLFRIIFTDKEAAQKILHPKTSCSTGVSISETELTMVLPDEE